MRSRIAFFDAKEYDISSFDRAVGDDITIKYYETKLTEDTAELARGYDVDKP